jgi:hypothetical protein
MKPDAGLTKAAIKSWPARSVSMRVLPTFLAACLLTAPGLAKTNAGKAVVRAADPCTREADRQAFDIEGLKSQLMVTVEMCKGGASDKYNEFMTSYKPRIAGEEKDLNAYFKRVYGRQSQKAYDDYITNLANVQAQEATKAGTAYCDILPDMFDEVLSLHDSSELLDYAHSKPIVQPVAFSTCTDLPAKASKAVRTRHTKHKA